MIENIVEINKENLIDEVQKMKDEGYRFITASCVDMGQEFMIYYHFDKGNSMKHLKIISSKEEEIPSISNVYFAGVLVENEMKDLFGVKIKDMAIDYGGKFLITGDVGVPPFLVKDLKTKEKGEVH